MTTRRLVATQFCTASNSTAESLTINDELEFTVSDAMFANLTLSPTQTSTQLNVVAEPPKLKKKGREKRAKQRYVFHRTNKETMQVAPAVGSVSLACGVDMNADNCPLLKCNCSIKYPISKRQCYI